MKNLKEDKNYLEKLVNSKKSLSEDQAKLPYEEKVMIVIELQKIAKEFSKNSEENVIVWKI